MPLKSHEYGACYPGHLQLLPMCASSVDTQHVPLDQSCLFIRSLVVGAAEYGHSMRS